MTTPIPGTPVAMVALTTLRQECWAGRRPDVHSGQPFWARTDDSVWLQGTGMARLWQNGDPVMPPWEPPHTAHQLPGIAAGASNGSPGVGIPQYAGPPPAPRQN